MHSARHLVEAVGSWLHFELRCGRGSLFDEAYLSFPVGQYLIGRYGSQVRAEFEHPVLAPLMAGRGDRPRIDYAVLGTDGKLAAVIEAKWLRSVSDLRLLVRDLLRLELAASTGVAAFALVAGQKRALELIFNSSQFAPHPDHPQSRPLLPLHHNNPQTLRIHPGPQYRRRLFVRACEPLRGVDLPTGIVNQRQWAFPNGVRSQEHLVYSWRVTSLTPRSTFQLPLPGAGAST
jgi:hypothetical protein